MAVAELRSPLRCVSAAVTAPRHTRLERVFPSHGRGRRFETCYAHFEWLADFEFCDPCVGCDLVATLLAFRALMVGAVRAMAGTIDWLLDPAPSCGTQALAPAAIHRATAVCAGGRGCTARPGRPHPRGHPGADDADGDFLWSSLLGEQARLLRRQGRLGSGCCDRLPERALSGAAELDRAGVSQPHLLQRGRQGQHFAAWQEPNLFTTEVRTAFRSLR
jgi:hypothetical protein